jgi:hypothetical protein
VASSVLVAEAKACRDGVRLAWMKGFRRIIVESDSLELASLWKNRGQQRSEIAVILEEIQELSMSMELFEWNHTRRLANIVLCKTCFCCFSFFCMA